MTDININKPHEDLDAIIATEGGRCIQSLWLQLRAARSQRLSDGSWATEYRLDIADPYEMEGDEDDDDAPATLNIERLADLVNKPEPTETTRLEPLSIPAARLANSLRINQANDGLIEDIAAFVPETYRDIFMLACGHGE